MKTQRHVNCTLLVDDDHPMSFLNKIIINEENFSKTTQSVYKGKEAIDYLNHPDKTTYPTPDIMFIDINMPGMNGWELIERIHFRDDLKDTLLFILTSSDAPKDVEKAQSIDAISGIFEKPLSKATLQTVAQMYKMKRTKNKNVALVKAA